MDLCHCAEPAPERIYGTHTTPRSSSLVCLNCRLPYDEAEWKSDPRVKRAQLEARQFTKEQQDIVDSIMRDGQNDKLSDGSPTKT